MIRNKFSLLLLIAIAVQFITSFSFADCVGCNQSRALITKKTTEITRVHNIKQKNMDYLERVKNASVSVQIKIASNMAIADMQTETLQNQITLIQMNLPKQCKGCP